MILALLLACPKPSDTETAGAGAPQTPGVQTLEYGLEGLGPCRRYSLDINVDGARGSVNVAEDDQAKIVDCVAWGEFVLEPAGRETLELGARGQSAKLRDPVEYVRARTIVIAEPGEQDNPWLVAVDQVSDGKRDPTGRGDPYAIYSFYERLFLVFEVYALTTKNGRSPYHPELDYAPPEYWANQNWDYCTANEGYFDNISVYRAGTTTISDRSRGGNTQGRYKGVRTHCSKTHPNVVAVEISTATREPIDVNFEAAGADRWIRLHLDETTTLAVVSLSMKLRYGPR